MTRSLVLLALATATACADPPHAPREYCSGTFSITDPALADAASAAAEEWRVASDGRVAFTVELTDAPADEWTIERVAFADGTLGEQRGTTLVVRDGLDGHYLHLTLLHEMGHLVGLDHERERGRLMSTSARGDGVDAYALAALEHTACR